MRSALNRHTARYRFSRLGSGDLTAHRSFRLMLLRSRPDMVHRFLLRKTQASTLLKPGSRNAYSPRQNITPAIADFRYREPLLPRLHGQFSV